MSDTALVFRTALVAGFVVLMFHRRRKIDRSVRVGGHANMADAHAQQQNEH